MRVVGAHEFDRAELVRRAHHPQCQTVRGGDLPLAGEGCLGLGDVPGAREASQHLQRAAGGIGEPDALSRGEGPAGVRLGVLQPGAAHQDVSVQRVDPRDQALAGDEPARGGQLLVRGLPPRRGGGGLGQPQVHLCPAGPIGHPVDQPEADREGSVDVASLGGDLGP
jgi:hypothetical protein